MLNTGVVCHVRMSGLLVISSCFKISTSWHVSLCIRPNFISSVSLLLNCCIRMVIRLSPTTVLMVLGLAFSVHAAPVPDVYVHRPN